jgi:Fur family transcriptional regulator, ferric uptake regulator
MPLRQIKPNKHANKPIPANNQARVPVSAMTPVAATTGYLARIPDAEAAIRKTSDRLTQPRVAVLACLMSQDHAASHFDIAQALAKHHPIDRVTVYRVLEWLVDVGIAHRIAGDDRVWRFMVNEPDAKVATHHQHAHFTCVTCGQTFCLDDVPTTLNFQLPPGFQTRDVDLKFRGHCAHCVAPAA